MPPPPPSTKLPTDMSTDHQHSPRPCLTPSRTTVTARTYSTERKETLGQLAGRFVHTLAVARRTSHTLTCRGARDICPTETAAASPRRKEEWCGRADSHRRNTSLSVTRQRRRVDDGQTRTHTAHGRRPADTRDFLHAVHNTSLRMLCAPGAGGGGQKRSLQGKKRPFQDLASPLPPSPLRCKVLTVCGPAGVGEYRISVSCKWGRVKRADGRAPAGGACC